MISNLWCTYVLSSPNRSEMLLAVLLLSIGQTIYIISVICLRWNFPNSHAKIGRYRKLYSNNDNNDNKIFLNIDITVLRVITEYLSDLHKVGIETVLPQKSSKWQVQQGTSRCALQSTPVIPKVSFHLYRYVPKLQRLRSFSFIHTSSSALLRIFLRPTERL
jgi:hypothetical protein